MGDYNGWSNYETWCTNLWLDNDPGTYDTKRQIIREARSEYEAGKVLQAYVEGEIIPEIPTGLASDFVNTSLGEVNWQEIVSADWAEIRGEEDAENAG